MPALDQLEVIGPTGEIRFVDLDPARGVTNIGSHPENDVVLDSPDVALFHAILSIRYKVDQTISGVVINIFSVGITSFVSAKVLH